MGVWLPRMGAFAMIEFIRSLDPEAVRWSFFAIAVVAFCFYIRPTGGGFND